MSNGRKKGGEEGILWKLPHVRVRDIGKVGPAFGLGAGCGIGFGLGVIGGVGVGPGLPGLQLGLGFGGGCGVGIGFGYGVGRGVAYDHNGSYSNLGKPSLSQIEINALIDEIVDNTKKLVRTASREIDKWRR